METATTNSPGGQPGNDNSASPPKSGQDNGTNASNADVTGTNAERGQQQDAGNNPDTTGGN